MTFTPAQTKVLENLYKHAERKVYGTPEYLAVCFEHALSIYLEFGSFRGFHNSIDAYNGTPIGAFHDFSAQMFMLGISHDDFRMPELLAVMANELKANPTGPLNTMLQRAKGKFQDCEPPRLLDDEKKLRFNLDNYLAVYAACLERSLPKAVEDPSQHESLACLLRAIKTQSEHHFQGLVEGLRYSIYKHDLAYDNAVRQAALGPNVDTEEVMGRLRYIVTQPAGAENGDLSLRQAETFIEIIDNQIRLHGLVQEQFIGQCDFLFTSSANSGISLRYYWRRLSTLMIYLVEELGTRGFSFEKELIARCMGHVHSLSVMASKMTKFDGPHRSMSEDDHKELQALCVGAMSYVALDTPSGRLRCLVGALVCADNTSPWLGSLLGKLIDRVDPQVIQDAHLTDLEAMGLYRHTRLVRDLQRIQSGEVRDRIFGADLGI
ncbi:hypothetical protein [Pseudomonas sp. CFBP 13719]|uniref:hypothetical protein n=1 Tax=Pseudomonas sp. CFBP 13719 TaxID=2775303 RepID=UPI0017870914|nr:hypothetical protein [Pseudomonas sp. CFBP 13719]MBD8681662.1 hypothetical protein [Pseudomonas sp. CFBP 13719]